MKGSLTTKWGVLSLCVLLALSAAGCTKKQTVKAQEGAAAAPTSPQTTSGPATTGAGPATTGPAAGGNVPAVDVDKGAPADTKPAPDVVAEAKNEVQKGVDVTQNKVSPFADIRFDFDQYTIREDAKPTLEKVAAYLRSNPGARLRIEGHCDERGTNEYNMALGERRADSTRKYLVTLGANGANLTTVSLGEEKPLELAHDEAAWAVNRRAHFDLQ